MPVVFIQVVVLHKLPTMFLFRPYALYGTIEYVFCSKAHNTRTLHIISSNILPSFPEPLILFAEDLELSIEFPWVKSGYI